MTNLRTKLAAIVGATGLTVGLLALGAAPALASPGVSQVTICHATASQTNPYVREPVAISSAGYLNAAGHADHTGPVWYPGIVVPWGDIIPPYDYTSGDTTFHFDGLNWDATGQATYNNDCNFEQPLSSPVSSPLSSPVVQSSPSVPSPSASFSATQAGATAIPSEPNTATLGSAGTFGPSNGSWLLVAALGVLLSSVVVMTPARVRSRR